MKVKRMKALHVGLAVVLGSTILSGCGGITADTKATEKPAAGKAEPLKLSIMAPLWNEVPEMNNAIFTEIQKRTNTKLEVQWIPRGDFNSKLDLVLASGELPDIIAVPDAKYLPVLNAVRQGVFWDLTPYLSDLGKYPNFQKNLPKGVLNFLKVDGKIYSLPRTRPPVDGAPMIRKDWLDKFNLPEPKTIEEFHAALKTIVQGDPDGNGKNDTIGVDFYEDYGGAFGTFEPQYNSDKGLIYPKLTTAYTDFVDFYRKLYADGLVAKEFSLVKGNQYEEMFSAGKLVSYWRSANNDWTFQEEIKKVQPGASVTSLPALKGPKGYTVINTLGYAGAIYISKRVPEEKLKQILEFFNTTASSEESSLFYQGIPGVHSIQVDGQTQFTPLGQKEINITTAQFVVLEPDRWQKVYNGVATKAFNDALIEKFKIQEQIGKYRIHEVLTSETWLKVWPKYIQEWESMRTKAIISQISMDEYKAYVEKLNNLPDFKKSYQEFAQDYTNYEWR